MRSIYSSFQWELISVLTHAAAATAPCAPASSSEATEGSLWSAECTAQLPTLHSVGLETPASCSEMDVCATPIELRQCDVWNLLMRDTSSCVFFDTELSQQLGCLMIHFRTVFLTKYILFVFGGFFVGFFFFLWEIHSILRKKKKNLEKLKWNFHQIFKYYSYNILSATVKIIQPLLWDLSIENVAQSSSRCAHHMTSLENELPGRKATSEPQSPYLSILGV